MEGICKLIDRSCILLDRDEKSIENIITALTDQLSTNFPEIAPKELMQKTIDEGFHTVCMGDACAITHARCPEMEKTLMAVMRLSPPVDMKADDGKKVALVFLLVGPQKSASFHLKILSRLARLLHDTELREALIVAKTEQEFLQIIESKEV